MVLLTPIYRTDAQPHARAPHQPRFDGIFNFLPLLPMATPKITSLGSALCFQHRREKNDTYLPLLLAWHASSAVQLISESAGSSKKTSPAPSVFILPHVPPTLSYALVRKSSRAGRARSRLQGGRSSCIASIGLDLVGELSGFPLIPCSNYGLAQVVEGRTKKDGKNHGRLYLSVRGME